MLAPLFYDFLKKANQINFVIKIKCLYFYLTGKSIKLKVSFSSLMD